jgi:glycosyltransferase involved in cell wall biosynthesis
MAGHQVTVITGVPNFPKGKVFDGYRNRLWQQQTIAGIRVIRVWTYIAANQGFTKRTVDYLSYMFTAFLASLFVRRVDIIVGTSPQFFTVCAAYALSLIKRVPWVFELRDIWPESIQVVGAMKQGRLLDLLEKIELFLYSRADCIVTVTYAFKSSLMSRNVDENKIHVVPNGVDIKRFYPRSKDVELIQRYDLEGKFIAGYIGTHGLAHALGVILDAAKIMKMADDGDHFRIILLGDGATKLDLQQRAQAEGLENIIFIDSVLKDQVTRYWSLLDVSIIHLKNDKLFTTVIPSKLFESMAMAIPVLHGVKGESADIIKHEDVGLVFEPENPEMLIANLRELANNSVLHQRLKYNGPIAAMRYARGKMAIKMLKVLAHLVNSKSKVN